MGDWHLIYIVGNVRCRSCLCYCLNDLNLVVYDPTKINFWMFPRKLPIRWRWLFKRCRALQLQRNKRIIFFSSTDNYVERTEETREGDMGGK